MSKNKPQDWLPVANLTKSWRKLRKIKRSLNVHRKKVRKLLRREKKLNSLPYVRLWKLSENAIVSLCSGTHKSRTPIKEFNQIRENCSNTGTDEATCVRKSIRKTRRKVLKEKHDFIEEKIISGIEEGLEERNIIGKGRSVFTTREFKRGEFVAEYAGELINNDVAKIREFQYAQNTSIGCYMYYFSHNNRNFCVDATKDNGKFGRLINHSKMGNLSTKSFVIADTPHLIFIANRDIAANEELLYDYGDRRRKSVAANPWLAT